MSPGLGAVFQLVEKVSLRVLCHSSAASVCGSFARQSSAFSGLFQSFVELIGVRPNSNVH